MCASRRLVQALREQGVIPQRVSGRASVDKSEIVAEVLVFSCLVGIGT